LLRRGALGDLVMLGAATAALTGPVTVVTAPQWVPLALRLRGVTAAVAWPRDATPRELAAAIPRGRVIDLHGSIRSRRLARALGGAERTVDKRSASRRLRLWLRAGGPRPFVGALYAEAVGVTPAAPPWIELPVLQRDTLAIAPGAAWPTKRYPVDRLGAVAARWEGPVVVLGGPGEEAACEAIARAVPRAQVVVERGFDRTLTALARTRVALAGDTGLMHLAGATGAQVVAVFGPTHVDDGFFGYPGQPVSRAQWCRPCTLKGRDRCPLGHHRCMDISADTVWTAVQRAAATEP
jgi:ADP-heptose:LPS heptosyltransferase